jgi:hypothetical protein
MRTVEGQCRAWAWAQPAVSLYDCAQSFMRAHARLERVRGAARFVAYLNLNGRIETQVENIKLETS